MITNRTLKRWRQDALVRPRNTNLLVFKDDKVIKNLVDELNDRILRLTQELMDARLVEDLRRNK